MLNKIQLRPGVNRESTNYSGEGGWWACDKARFRSGYPEKVGGWVKYSPYTYLGAARTLFNWTALDTKNFMFVGTNLKAYIEYSQDFYDITPIRRTASLSGTIFAVTAGSNSVLVTDNGHGATDGDFVIYSITPAASLTVGGLVIIPASGSAQYQISYVSTSQYRINVAGTATGGSGGTSLTAEYQINTGLDISSGGSGWGAGAWGRDTWGSGTTSLVFSNPRLWSADAFGQDLFFNVRDGGVYYWSKPSGLGVRAVALSSFATDAPVIAKKVLTSEIDRHALCFGCQPTGSSSATDQDPLLIRWSDTENINMWQPLPTNSAGGTRISTGNQIITAIRTKQETLVWTESGLHSLQFIGAPDYFSLQQLADNISIMGPNAVATANNVTYWMGTDKFYTYSGRVETLPCTLRQYLFGDFNRTQAYQVCAGTNEGFNEIWWFYCSADANENSRYIIYNYLEKLWYYGTINRSAWLDSPLRSFPTAAEGGYLYSHESGVDDDVSAMYSYIESNDFDVEDGDRLVFIRRIIPDLTFAGSTAATPSANLTVSARNFPGAAYGSPVATPVTRSATVPVEQFTQQAWIRLRGRQGNIKIESSALGVQWQLGSPRLDTQPDGKR